MQRSNEILRKIFRVTPFKRKAFFIISDFVLISLSMYGAFYVRFGGKILPEYVPNLVFYCLLSFLIKFGFLVFYGMYGFSWRFFGIQELVSLIKAVAFSSLILAVGLFFQKSYFPFRFFPRSVLVLDFIFTLALLGGLRISKSGLREYRMRKKSKDRLGIRVLIIGAGEAGRQIVREMRGSPLSKYLPIGYIDDDPAKQGLLIEGEKVLGTRKDIPRIMKEYEVGEALVAIPSGSAKEIREIIRLIRASGGAKKIQIVPSVIRLMERNIALKDIHEIKVEDLLGRTQVTVDFEVIGKFLRGRRVLITGAAGSIGSELTSTALQFQPEELLALDNDETEIFTLTNQMRLHGFEILPVIADIRDGDKIEQVFSGFKPEIVVHSAAYKHVPILERFADEAVKTNILGTKNIGEAAIRHGVEKFVFISTDKAINPTSIMGASKRIGEEILRTLNQRNGTKFISVRFGNVLGSRGSVIPIFKEQIARGGPVTVTHSGMKRYFMAPTEAVLLVLEAAAVGDGGETYILDMGDPVRIEDLAKEMIRLSGFEPGAEIPIIYTGLRPGEKLFEELLGSAEEMEALPYEKIFRVKTKTVWDEKELFGMIGLLGAASRSGSERIETTEIFKKIVPSYKPDSTRSSRFSP